MTSRPDEAKRPSPLVMMDPFSCAVGGAHELIFQGGEQELYRCGRCGAYISKSRLKRLTDTINIENV
jgi:uncharacterized Zn finger protein